MWRLIYFNQRLLDFINCWLEFQSTVDKIYQPLIEIYQLLIFFINGMLFDNHLLTVTVGFSGSGMKVLKLLLRWVYSSRELINIHVNFNQWNVSSLIRATNSHEL